jgi:hypothetical protein
MIDYGKIRNPEIRKLLQESLMGHKVTAGGTVPAYRLVKIDSSGDHVVSTIDSENVIGANAEDKSISSGGILYLEQQKPTLVAATPIKAGKYLKSADNGRATQLVTNDVSGSTIDSSTGGDFANQPANDGVEVLSDEAADTGIDVTIIGTTNGGQTVVVETVSTDATDGTTPVSTTKTDWGVILAVKLGAAAAGTITIREASGDGAITTITAGNTSAGVVEVPAADQGAFNVAPVSVAGGVSTKYIGIQYTATDGSTVSYQADQLSGTSAQTFTTAALLITELYVGDVAAATTVTVKVGAEEDELHAIGKSLTAAAAADAEFSAKLF